MTLRRDPSKALQIGFLALLAVSMAQVAWWITDSVLHAREVEQHIEALYRADAQAASAWLGRLPSASEVSTWLPHLEIDAGAVRVRPAALDTLRREGAQRINRFLWEGGFFLVVLLGGMAVLTRTIRHDAELRRRQQNFLAAVSHEFKSPLASVRLAAETLVLRAQEADSQRLGQRIIEDGDRLLRMVDNLLETTRLEEGRHALSPTIIALPAVAGDVVAEMEARARAHDIELSLEIPEDSRLPLDRTALETILRNALDNAIKACVAGAGRSIRVEGVREGGRIELSVRDDGLGFPPEDAMMIFEKFYRLGNELQRSTPGTGLGLYIAKRLAELSGARISAASDGVGRGATITLSWPDCEAA